MEKKTMGSFLAALRRANGMTQKELAERLNVSDKSVSRWERDDGAPDLALIPVIAEVFGVTCDELLRGERAAAGEEQGAQSTPKGEQQKKHLLAASLSRFRSRCCIALACSFGGFLVAMAFNSALDRALLGFFLGAAFFVAAAAAEAVQLNAALLAIHDEEGENVDAFRRAVVRGAERTYGAAWVLFACTLPLLWAFHPVTINGFTVSRTGVGVSLTFWQAALVLLAAVLLAFFAVWIAERRLVKKRFLPPEEKTEAQRKNDRLLRTTALTLCAALALSAFINRALVGFGDTRRLAEGTEFTDFDSFVRYMRKPVEPTYYGDAAPAPDTAVAESPLYYENDTPIYRSQTEGATIEDDNGNVLCNFIWRNRSVVFWRTGPKADGYLPVTVYTQEAMSLAQQKAKHINTVFYGVYAAEAVAALAIYLRKREK